MTEARAGTRRGDPNHRNNAPPHNHGLPMTFVWLICLSLVLGGVAGMLWPKTGLRGRRLRVARVPVRKHRPVAPAYRETPAGQPGRPSSFPAPGGPPRGGPRGPAWSRRGRRADR